MSAGVIRPLPTATDVPTSERTIWWQKALAWISKRSTVVVRVRGPVGLEHRAGRATAPAMPPATAWGAGRRREVVLAEQRGARLAHRVEVERLGAPATTGGARNGSGTVAVEDRVAVAAPRRREAGVEVVGRRPSPNAPRSARRPRPFSDRWSAARSSAAAGASKVTTWPQAWTPAIGAAGAGELDRLAEHPVEAALAACRRPCRPRRCGRSRGSRSRRRRQQPTARAATDATRSVEQSGRSAGRRSRLRPARCAPSGRCRPGAGPA